MTRLSHIEADGRAVMVDIAGKSITDRRAIATGRISLQPETLAQACSGKTKKGDPLAIAELAGIMGAKRTSDLIPLCHPLALTKVKVEIAPSETEAALLVTATAATSGQTGVEMEALTAVSIACLTLYDMLKAIDKTMQIGPIRLIEKTGGKTDLLANSGG